MLDDLCRNIAANINIFKEKINEVSVRIQDMEITPAAHETRLTTLESELSILKRDQTLVHHCMVAMEEHRRWKNVKVWALQNQSHWQRYLTCSGDC
ncbi:Hypothetical predicted protein [Pelobates cultripes]|uniref:Uncharacterized protein n=1 Tax=Pelobates cultripes TaxID=61616 RepID=A0AAD1W5F9_PELCU|nr:Hypothetical predicted protein [Pelobates cultripes]